MKKLTFLLIVAMVCHNGFAQKKNGVVFSEHEVINQTKGLWEALINGDQETYKSFFTDSAVVVYNGNRDFQKIERNVSNMVWWSTNLDNLTIMDDKPAYPDAIEYKEGGMWVQDWIRIKGVHKTTGVRLNVPFHNLYSFNKEGKITSMHHYFNNDIFETIRESQVTRANGTLYVNHPYIAVVRKVVNALCDKDLDAMAAFLDEKALFHDYTMTGNESISWEEQRPRYETILNMEKDIEAKEIGYPDCVYYEQEDMMVVYSWWEFSHTDVKTGDRVSNSYMLTHNFNGDGLVTNQQLYLTGAVATIKAKK